MSNIIEVKNLTKKYGDFTAVNSITFDVGAGETFGILGPNGAGKTTTLEMIEGLKQITGGSVTVDNLDVASHPRDVKAIIGVQLQASSFFDGLNLKELLDIFAAMYNRKVDADKLLEQVQLTEKANSTARQLSGGQKQRLSIAVALVNDPKVIFLDEPTTGLDPQARRNLWGLITEIKKQGKTIVLTTHYMDEAEILCDRIAIMDNAKIIALDHTEQLLQLSGVKPNIQFSTNQPLAEEVLKKLPSVEEAKTNGRGYVLVTSSPPVTMPALFELASSQKFSISDLQLRQPSLEDVFLKLTGHSLRE